jgi:very-short-patch-repair endonuclease
MPRKAIGKGFVRNVRKRRPRQKSDLEQIVEGWLKEQGYEFKAQYPIGRCHVDVFFPPTRPGDKGTVVEINGCYWHGCSRCYKEKSKSQQRRRTKDAKRYRFLLNQGYDLIILWGCDISNNWPKVARALREAGNRGRR